LLERNILEVLVPHIFLRNINISYPQTILKKPLNLFAYIEVETKAKEEYKYPLKPYEFNGK
jgi:hypothetical protein